MRDRGIVDFRIFTDVHPEFVERCMSEIRVIDVNRHTLELFGAPDKPTLLQPPRRHLPRRHAPAFPGAARRPLARQDFPAARGVNYALDGNELHLHLQFSVLPGFEHDWSLVQVALTDITARKKAEAYLEFLGKHDVLTKLYNRSFYVDELNRLERKGPYPVTIIVADLNGLKAANDQLGHAAGDALLRRAGEVLNEAVDKPYTRGAHRRRRVRRPAARHGRARRRGDDGEHPETGGAQQPVLFGPDAVAIDRRGDQSGRRAAGGRGEAGRPLMYEEKRAYYAAAGE